MYRLSCYTPYFIPTTQSHGTKIFGIMDSFDSNFEQSIQDASEESPPQANATTNGGAVDQSEMRHNFATPPISLSMVTTYSGPMRAHSFIAGVMTHTEISRIQTQRSQHGHTVGSSLHLGRTQRSSKVSLPAFGGGKPYPSPLPDEEEYIVEFDGETDQIHGQNWSIKKK
jgi:MFS transporter, DHA1 family, multidrug resistance protein